MTGVFLMATRFNEITRLENSRYRANKFHTGCIYGVPRKISDSIPHQSPLLVVEMDISIDSKKIIGIGFITNKMDPRVHCKIYSTPKFNRYVYFSDYRVDFHDMNDDEKFLMGQLSLVLFKTKNNIQRSIGITKIPHKNLSFLSNSIQKRKTIADDTSVRILNIFKRKYNDGFKI